MSLTLESEQRLSSVGLVTFYDITKDEWLSAAEQTYQFVKQNFPADVTIRKDDVAKLLNPIVAVHEGLQEKLNTKKIRGKLWIGFFTDLIIDRTWDEITKED